MLTRVYCQQINFFLAQILAKFNFFLSKRFFQNSVVLKLLISSLLHLIHEWNWTKLVTNVGKLLGMDITQNDISVGHRMPQSQKHKGKPGPPAIIVKFAKCDVKDNFYHARKQLKDLTTRDLGYSEKNKIFLAESLTERNWILFKDCLKVKKDMEFKFIWTLNGKIFMRKDKDSAVHHINNKGDLQKIQTR